MVDKVMSVADAVSRFVDDGDYLASGGFGGDRIATAVLHEIVRQKRQNLGLAGHTSTHDFQILCAGNLTGRGQLLDRVDAAYIVGLEARGLSPHARRVMQSGTVAVCEWSNCTLALRFQAAAPNLTLMFEAGGVGPLLPRMPISVGDSRTFHQGLMATSMGDVMETCQRGLVDYTFLGGAQIDMFGNLNSTRIGGDHQQPKVRLPGSGGANDLGSLCWRILVITPHDQRRFAERVDFITTPGFLDGPGAREKAGLPPGTGPYKVITNLAVLGFNEESKRMHVESLHPNVTLDEVRANTGLNCWSKSRWNSRRPPMTSNCACCERKSIRFATSSAAVKVAKFVSMAEKAAPLGRLNAAGCSSQKVQES